MCLNLNSQTFRVQEVKLYICVIPLMIFGLAKARRTQAYRGVTSYSPY